MRCQFCGEDAQNLVYLRFYTKKGIRVCSDCRAMVERNKHKPYSKVMERLAILEAGYKVNRKVARR